MTRGRASPPGPRARTTPSWPRLVVEADVPNDVYLHLMDALLAWAPLMGEHLFPIEPEAGIDTGPARC